MDQILGSWLESWQNLSFKEFKSLLPSLNLPGAIAVYSSSGSLLQISYLGNLQKFEQLGCQFGATFELMGIFDPEFYVAYWAFPAGLTDLEVVLPDAIARIAEDLPLQSRKSLEKNPPKRQQRSLPVPFAEEESLEENLAYA